MNTLARILLVEDSPNDVEMMPEAFAECRLADGGDGQEALIDHPLPGGVSGSV